MDGEQSMIKRAALVVGAFAGLSVLALPAVATADQTDERPLVADGTHRAIGNSNGVEWQFDAYTLNGETCVRITDAHGGGEMCGKAKAITDDNDLPKLVVQVRSERTGRMGLAAVVLAREGTTSVIVDRADHGSRRLSERYDVSNGAEALVVFPVGYDDPSMAKITARKG